MRQICNFLSLGVMCIAFGLTLMSCANDDAPANKLDEDPGINVGVGAGYKVSAGDLSLQNSSGWSGHWYDFDNEGELENFDASAYDYVMISFKQNTGKFRFGITYNEWKSTEAWGETYFDNVDFIEAPEGISFIKLEKTKTYEFGGPDKAQSPYWGDTWDKHIRQVFTQDDGNEVSVQVDGVWFCTGDELESILSGSNSAAQ